MSVLMIALANIRYAGAAGAINDPLFAAHDNTSNPSWYSSDEPAGLVACVDRYQFGDISGNLVTNFGGIDQVSEAVRRLGFNNNQLAAALRIIRPANATPMAAPFTYLGANALLAQRERYSSRSTFLPPEMYVLEFRRWFELTLASIQHSVVEFASKRYTNIIIPAEDSADTTEADNDTEEDPSSGETALEISMDFDGYTHVIPELESMAERQKIRNVAGYQTFSVMGLGLIFGVGCFIIVLSWIIEPLYGFLSRCRGFRKHSRDRGYTDITVTSAMTVDGLAKAEHGDKEAAENKQLRQWQLDSVFHLQRLAYPNVEHGRWTRENEDVPVASGSLHSPYLDQSNSSSNELQDIRVGAETKSQQKLSVAETCRGPDAQIS